MKKSFFLITIIILSTAKQVFSFNNSIINLDCPAPIVNTFSPINGPVNTLVTINGSNFMDAATVSIDGINSTFTIVNDSEITVLIPADATNSSVISIISNGGCTGNSTNSFTVLDSSCATGEIYMSEIYDSEVGSYGVIELYNPTNAVINLDGVYEIQRFGDIGNIDPSFTIPLTGSILPTDTFIVQVGSNGNVCDSVTADIIIGSGINDNDEIKLLNNGTVIDVVEVLDERGYTIIRNTDATAPQSTFNENHWTMSGTENCTDLDSYSPDSNATTPNITHPLSSDICENSNTSFSVSVDSGSYTYQWKTLNSSNVWVDLTNNANYSGATTNTLTLNNVPNSFNGLQYYCEITSPSCNLISNAAQLNILSPLVDTISNQIVCSEYTLPTLNNGNYFTNPNGFGNQLSAGDVISNTQTVYIYNETGIEPNICSNETSFNVIINNVLIDTVPDHTVCAEYTLPALTNGNYFTGTNGSGSSLNANEIITESQIVYIYNSNNINGVICTNESSFEVTVNPSVDFTLNDSNIILEDNSISVIMTDDSVDYEYAIDTNDFQIDNVFTNLLEGLHTLYVQDINGCILKSFNFEISNDVEEFFIPQGFSPNGDGKNDWFNIQGLYDNYVNHKLEIYNRNGVLIFEGNNANKWYGIANKGLLKTDKTVPVGTYYYMLYLNDSSADSKPFSGWVYLNK
jgi:gliding motility-associated-like protein